MNTEEFWKDDPQLFVSYRTSFLNKKKKEMEEYDYKCWLQGLYIHDGNGKLVATLEQFFSGTKNQKQIEKYPSKPYTVLNEEATKKEETEERQKRERYNEFQSSLAYLGTMKKRFREKIKKGE